MEDVRPLPTSGPLGKKESYEPTNRDLLDNAYKQNHAINEVKDSVESLDSKVQGLSTTVASHTQVIDQLSQIKTIIIWMLSFVGIGGLTSLLNWVKLWMH